MKRNGSHKFWAFQKKGETTGELYLYGDIASYTWWGDEVTPKQFKDDLDALGDVKELHIFINSGGGDVFAGWSIINMLSRHKARKIGYNDGLAASIAFDILMSMDEVVAMENSMFMTHNCWTYALGNRHELIKQAENMEKIDLMLAETSAKRSGKTIEEIIALQDAETWYTAKEALAAGFADRVEEGAKLAAHVEKGVLLFGAEAFSLCRYKNPTMAEGLAQQDSTEAQETPDDEPIREPPEAGDTEQDALYAQERHFAEIRKKLIGGI